MIWSDPILSVNDLFLISPDKLAPPFTVTLYSYFKDLLIDTVTGIVVTVFLLKELPRTIRVFIGIRYNIAVVIVDALIDGPRLGVVDLQSIY